MIILTLEIKNMKITIYNDRTNNSHAPKKGYVRLNGEFIRPTSRTGKGSGGHDIFKFEVNPGDTFDARACSNVDGRKTKWNLRMKWSNFEVTEEGVRATNYDGEEVEMPDFIAVETEVEA